MNKYTFLKNLRDISNNYKGFIIDIWGVLCDGLELYEHAKITLEKLKEQNKKVLLLSNAPRRSQTVSDKLTAVGIDKNLYDDSIYRSCYTSNYS